MDQADQLGGGAQAIRDGGGSIVLTVPIQPIGGAENASSVLPGKKPSSASKKVGRNAIGLRGLQGPCIAVTLSLDAARHLLLRALREV